MSFLITLLLLVAVSAGDRKISYLSNGNFSQPSVPMGKQMIETTLLQGWQMHLKHPIKVAVFPYPTTNFEMQQVFDFKRSVLYVEIEYLQPEMSSTGRILIMTNGETIMSIDYNPKYSHKRTVTGEYHCQMDQSVTFNVKAVDFVDQTDAVGFQIVRMQAYSYDQHRWLRHASQI